MHTELLSDEIGQPSNAVVVAAAVTHAVPHHNWQRGITAGGATDCGGNRQQQDDDKP